MLVYQRVSARNWHVSLTETGISKGFHPGNIIPRHGPLRATLKAARPNRRYTPGKLRMFFFDAILNDPPKTGDFITLS